MLAKVDATGVYLNQDIPLMENNEELLVTWSSAQTKYNYTSKEDFNRLTVTYETKWDNNSQANGTIKGMVAWSQVFSDSVTGTTYTQKTFTNFSISKWDEFYVNIQAAAYAVWKYCKIYVKNFKLYAYIENLYKNIKTHKALPRELKTIWNKATATLFGMHTDNTRYTGENE